MSPFMSRWKVDLMPKTFPQYKCHGCRSVEPAPLVLDASKQASQIMPFNLAQKPELAAMVARS